MYRSVLSLDIEETMMVIFDKVEKTYPTALERGSVRALRGVSFSMERGEVVAYVGRNGAGKTTSLNILLGLIRPTAGTILINDTPPVESHVRNHVGYLPERPYFYEQLTALQFLRLMGKLSHMKSADITTRAESLLERLDIASVSHRRLRSFSRGMLQRLGIAQAMIHDPELLVLDEPLGGLDPMGRKLVRDVIMDARKSGKTVLYSSHILSDAELIADRVVVINRGVILKDAHLDELRETSRGLVEVTLGPSATIGLEELSARWNQGKRSGGAFTLTVSDHELQQIISTALSIGAEVREICTPRVSLEDALVELMDESAHEGGVS